MLKLKPTPPKSCLFVFATRTDCRYIVVERGQPRPKLLGGGVFELQDGPLAEQVRDHAAEQQELRVRHAVLLVPRSELEIVSLHLPPTSEAELPQLVQGALWQELDDGAASRVSDFLVTHQDSQSVEVTAFTVDGNLLQRWKGEFKAAGLNLVGVTFSGSGAAEILPSLAPLEETNVIVTVGDQDLDLVISADEQPILFRTIPWSADDDHRLAERLGEEIPRTVSLAHRLAEDESPRVHLVGEPSEVESQQRQLSDLISNSVSVVDPFDLIECRAPLTQPSRYANLIGAALAWNRQALALNLLAPRRPVPPPGPWRKIAAAAVLCGAVLSVLGYQAWSERAGQLTALAERQQKLKTLAKRAAKAKELQRLAAAVSEWRRDDIAWLDELRRLAEQLPAADEALVRKMNLAVDGQRQGVIDLSVQVSRPEVVARLEDALREGERSVSSQRVSESDGKSKLPWGFDTRIVFQPPEPPELPIPETPPSAVAKDEEEKGKESRLKKTTSAATKGRSS